MARPISLYDLAFPWGPKRINRNLCSDKKHVRHVNRGGRCLKGTLLGNSDVTTAVVSHYLVGTGTSVRPPSVLA